MTITSKFAGRRRFEHLFFAGIALLILVEVFIGFGPTYYMAGVFSAPLPSGLVHVHATVFTLWVLLFMTQILLVTAGRTEWHRMLGVFGAFLACMLVMLGVLVATEFLVNHGEPSTHYVLRGVNYAVSLSDVLMFAVLIARAIWFRGKALIHKRLTLIATLSILDAAYDRWPIPVSWWDDRVSPAICTYPILLLLMLYDRWSTRRVQPATLWACALLVLVQQGRDPLGRTALWQSFSAWVYTHAHGCWLFQIHA